MIDKERWSDRNIWEMRCFHEEKEGFRMNYLYSNGIDTLITIKEKIKNNTGGVKKNSMIIDGEYVDEFYMAKIVDEKKG